MYDRRDKHHYVEKMTRAGTALAIGLVVLAAASSPLSAGDAVGAMNSDGVVHAIDVGIWSEGSKSGGTVLVHRVQQPDGSQASNWIPGTDNFQLETDPAIDIDGISGEPVAVWITNAGYGYAMVASRVVDGSWTEPVLLDDRVSANADPMIQVGQNLVHIFWRYSDASTDKRFRMALRRTNLQTVLGPEEIPTEAPNAIPASGETDYGSSLDPSSELLYFSTPIETLLTGEAPTLVVWGVRDEPIAVGYVQEFELPDGIRHISRSKAEWLSDLFTIRFTSGDQVYYSTRQNDRWNEFRVINLAGDRDESDAVLMIEEMIARESRLLPE